MSEGNPRKPAALKFVFAALVLASVVSLLCISLIPRTVTREQVAGELERMLAGESVIEKDDSEADWLASKTATEETYDAFGATVSRSGSPIRIYFDQKKLRFQKHPVAHSGAGTTP